MSSRAALRAACLLPLALVVSATQRSTPRPVETAAAPRPIQTIEGVVLRDGAPVDHGRAWLVRRPVWMTMEECSCAFGAGASATIRADGRFRFDGVAVGDYSVTVGIAPDEVRGFSQRVASGSSARAFVRFGASAIRGRVFERDGSAVADARVRVTSTSTREGSGDVCATGSTDARGAYRIGGLPPGSYTVSATDHRFAVDVEIGSAEECALDFGSPLGRHTWNGDVLVPDRSPYTGVWNVRVVAKASGATRALHHVAYSAFDEALAPGAYALQCATPSGWRTFDELEMPARELARDIVLPPAWVCVTVRAAHGEYHADVVRLVRVGDPSRAIAAGARDDGVFHFVGVPPGEYEAWLGGAVRGKKEPPKARVTITQDDVRVRAEIVVPEE